MMRIDFANIDRRIVYLLVVLALATPLLFHYTVPPARLSAADKTFDLIESLEVKPGEVAFVSLDFGPNTIAENGPQSEVMIEHLFRKHLPVLLFTTYYQGAPFLDSIPEKVAARLEKELPGQHWTYGRDWVNLGYRPGSALLVQAIPKSEDLQKLFIKDAKGNNLGDLPAMKGVRSFQNFKIFAQFTGLTGTLEMYMQFFQSASYRPIFVHGCTSITIPMAYIYLDSGQLRGLLEGIAGAAWYSVRLKQASPARGVDESLEINTGLGVAQLVVLLLIVLGNVSAFIMKRRVA